MKEYYILSLKWSNGKGIYVWWGPGNSGYTNDLNQAGIYTEDQIKSRPLYYKNTNTVPVGREIVDKLQTQRTVPSLSSNWELMNIDPSSLKEY